MSIRGDSIENSQSDPFIFGSFCPWKAWLALLHLGSGTAAPTWPPRCCWNSSRLSVPELYLYGINCCRASTFFCGAVDVEYSGSQSNVHFCWILLRSCLEYSIMWWKHPFGAVRCYHISQRRRLAVSSVWMENCFIAVSFTPALFQRSEAFRQYKGKDYIYRPITAQWLYPTQPIWHYIAIWHANHLESHPTLACCLENAGI